jgi:hypothetical protein
MSGGPQGMAGGQVHNQVAMQQQFLKLAMQRQQIVFQSYSLGFRVNF